jgi:polysaccharide export outer membrane protein
VLGPGDVVEVDVLGRGDFKTRTRIRSDGTIVLPFIGVVRAASLSAQELSNQVATACAAAASSPSRSSAWRSFPMPANM